MKLNNNLSLVLVAVLGIFAAQIAFSVPAQRNSGSQVDYSEQLSPFDWFLLPVMATIDEARRFLVGRAGGDLSQTESANFRAFMQLYNKTYSPEELPFRMSLFLERQQLIDESARLFEQGRALFRMAENRFIDWTRQEIEAMLGLDMPPDLQQQVAANDDDDQQEQRDSSGGAREGSDNHAFDEGGNEEEGSDEQEEELEGEAITTTKAPELSFGEGTNHSDGGGARNDSMTVKYNLPVAADWRLGGCISPPDDQDKCGSCYAIAVVHAIEAKRCINMGQSPHLSTQQIIDCASAPVSANYHVNGCTGGWPTHVLNYFQNFNLVAREKCYPYTNRKGNYCRMREMHSVPGCTLLASPLDTPQLQFQVLHNEEDVLWALYHVGPVISIIQATDAFLYYSRGIFDDPKCTNRDQDVDHTVLIVGYGEQGGVPYWVVKNSWGDKDWGEQGYAKVRRGVNACSIGRWAWSITS